MADKSGRQAAQQTFRQFAWNLAGTLAGAPAAGQGQPAGRAGATAKGRQGKTGAPRGSKPPAGAGGSAG